MATPTFINRNPTVKDLIQTTKFRLNFDRLQGITYFCQSISLPGVSLTEVPRPTPFVDLYVPGEKLVYDTFNITFLVDEELYAWTQIHDWLRAMTFPTDFKEYRDLSKLSKTSVYRNSTNLPPQYTDASVSFFTNKNNQNIMLKLKDVFPTYLGPILFNASDSAENIPIVDASFRYSYFDIERV